MSGYNKYVEKQMNMSIPVNETGDVKFEVRVRVLFQPCYTIFNVASGRVSCTYKFTTMGVST